MPINENKEHQQPERGEERFNSYEPTTSELDDNNPPSEDSDSSE